MEKAEDEVWRLEKKLEELFEPKFGEKNGGEILKNFHDERKNV